MYAIKLNIFYFEIYNVMDVHNILSYSIFTIKQFLEKYG